MASIKNLKSKGWAIPAVSVGLGLDGRPNGEWRIHSTEYDYRKAQFAALPPAKVVRPLRAVRKVYATALGLWERSVIKSQREGGDILAYPHGEEAIYRAAMRFAKAGQGHLVHHCAS